MFGKQQFETTARKNKINIIVRGFGKVMKNYAPCDVSRSATPRFGVRDEQRKTS